jgi:hypothetical protein
MILPLIASALCVGLVVPSTNTNEDQVLAGYVKVEIQGELHIEGGSGNWSAIVDGKEVRVTITAPGPRDMSISKHQPHDPGGMGPGGENAAKKGLELVKKPAGITWEIVLGANKDFHDFVKQHKGKTVVVKGTVEIIEEFGGPDGKGWTTAAASHSGPPPSPRVIVKVTEMQVAKLKKK